jgi:uncharacterized SAM-binding protein YcdF (DUF218 family)
MALMALMALTVFTTLTFLVIFLVIIFILIIVIIVVFAISNTRTIDRDRSRAAQLTLLAGGKVGTTVFGTIAATVDDDTVTAAGASQTARGRSTLRLGDDLVAVIGFGGIDTPYTNSLGVL